jgi:hypothetical protein
MGERGITTPDQPIETICIDYWVVDRLERIPTPTSNNSRSRS